MEQTNTTTQADNKYQPERACNWSFDFTDRKLSAAQALAKAQECVLVLADMSTVLSVCDVRELVERNYDLTLCRYGHVMEMLAIGAHNLLGIIESESSDE